MSNANSPAYPMAPTYSPDGNFDGGGHVGLTIRERFAMAAMQGLCADEQYVVGMDKPSQYQQIATRAIRYADALIAELAKEPKP